MKKGEILKIKQGYNPNSSSIGTLLIAFPCTLFILFFLFTLILPVIISGKIKKIREEKKSDVNEKQ